VLFTSPLTCGASLVNCGSNTACCAVLWSTQVFRELVEAVKLKSDVDITPTTYGNGIAAMKAVKKGEVGA
jgi:hypothetical protein